MRRHAIAIAGCLFLTACGGKISPTTSSSVAEIKAIPESSPTPFPTPSPTFTDLPPGDQYNPSTGGGGTSKIPYPKSMAALGDSITAGFIANLKRGDWLNPSQLQSIVSSHYDIQVRGSDAVKRVEQRELSWAGGLDGDVRSHAYRIKKKTGKIRVFNAAITGAEAKDMQDYELDDVLDWARKELGQGAPDYVTLMIGPNDVCADKVSGMTPVADYSDRVDRVVKTLLEANPGTRVLVNTIPRIDTLRKIAKDARAVAFGYTCSDLWKQVNLCKTLTYDDHDSTHEAAKERVRDYNAELKKITDRYRLKYGDRVRLATKVYETEFTQDDLSVDCFHPNPRGQNKIADSSWKSSWWAD